MNKKTCKCLHIALYEIIKNKFLFFFYSVIFILLFSISLNFFEMAFNIPSEFENKIKGTVMEEINIDNVNKKDINIVRELPANVKTCNSNFIFDESSLGLENIKSKNIDNVDYFSGCFVIWKDENNYLVNQMNDRLLKGSGFTQNNIFEINKYSIWISEKFAKKFDLKLNQILNFYLEDEKKVGEVEIIGVFKESKFDYDYYMSETLFYRINELNPKITLTITVSPYNFKDFFKIINILEKNYFPYNYSSDVIDSIKLLVFMLYGVTIILFITLVVIAGNLLEIYYQKRKVFYGINSAIGMTSRDILMVFFCISEIIIIFSLVFSFFISNFISINISEFINNLFELENLDFKTSFKSIFISFLTVNTMLLIVFLKIKKIISNDITKIINNN